MAEGGGAGGENPFLALADSKKREEAWRKLAMGEFEERSLVWEGMWLGNSRSAGLLFPHELKEDPEALDRCFEGLSKDGVSLIVSCIPSVSFAFEDRGMEYMHVPIGDFATRKNEEVIEEKLGEVVEAVRKVVGEGKAVLFHCNAGASRSATLLLLTLLQLHPEIPLPTLFKRVQAKRPIILPQFHALLKRKAGSREGEVGVD